MTREGGPEPKRRDIPGESLDLLFQEATRQTDELARAKDSVDNRAAFVIGLPGVILSVFVGIFVDFWTSSRPENLAQLDALLYWLAGFFTVAVVATLIGAVALGLSILLPVSFDIGFELTHAYEIAHDPEYDTLGLKEGSLRVLIQNLSVNIPTYLRNILRYNLASLFTLMALLFSAEFLGILLAGPGVADQAVGITAKVSIVAVTIIACILAFRRGVLVWRSSSSLVAEEQKRLSRFLSYTKNLEGETE